VCAFDALEEVERIDGLLRDYDDVLAAIRPRMDEKELNRDFSKTVERLRYDPDAVPPSQWTRESVMHAAHEIMKRFTGKKTNPPLS
jgi:hypothetical protein